MTVLEVVEMPKMLGAIRRKSTSIGRNTHRKDQKNADTHQIPPLESGDRLTRAEFERRYIADPEIKKAELIEGVVYVASPVRVRRHGAPHSRIIGWLTLYQAAVPRIEIADNSTFRLDLDNEPQPDVAVWLEGENAFVDDDDYLQGAPELIVEVAGSSSSIDLHAKRTIYRRAGVQEYLVLLTHERKVRWYQLQERDESTGDDAQISANQQGWFCSCVFPGLYLDATSFWQGNMTAVFAALQKGLESPEHAEFVKRLKEFAISASN